MAILIVLSFIDIEKPPSVSCYSFDNANKCFIEPLIYIGKVGKVASPDVVIELLTSKCAPALYYGCDCCSIFEDKLIR